MEYCTISGRSSAYTYSKNADFTDDALFSHDELRQVNIFVEQNSDFLSFLTSIIIINFVANLSSKRNVKI
jgi:hypothetical protein